MKNTSHFVSMFYEPEEHPNGFLLYRVQNDPSQPDGTPVIVVDCGERENAQDDFDVDAWEEQLTHVYFAPNKESWKLAYRLARWIKNFKGTEYGRPVGETLTVGLGGGSK